jgi:hypothetical protein
LLAVLLGKMRSLHFYVLHATTWKDAAMTRPEITGRKMTAETRLEPPVTTDEVDCYTVEEFCRRNRVSVPTFYKYPELMPDSFHIGARRLITKEAAARWRAEREAASNAKAATAAEAT